MSIDDNAKLMETSNRSYDDFYEDMKNSILNVKGVIIYMHMDALKNSVFQKI
ncbi:hypothetical protein [Methanobrevibacter sp.]|uniref:hypothetical protein n=1 Tax=Methanobrevibacter sp. TaxID=66852 RepID=UPI0038901E46